MTNAYMVSPKASGLPTEPNRTPQPSVPAPEDSPVPATTEDPIDSPQPNESGQRAAPDERHSGLSTDRR